MRGHRKRCPLVARVTELEADNATIQALLTTCQGTIAWHTRTINEADAEIGRLKADLADAEARVVRLTDVSEKQGERLGVLRAEHRADEDAWAAKMLDLKADLADAKEAATDPDGLIARLTRRLADAEKRADAAEVQGVKDRDAILDRDAQLCALRPHVRQVDAPAYVLDTGEGVTHPPLGGRP